MNKMEKALLGLREMDDLAARRSPVHDRCPLSKLLATVIYIATTASFGKYDLPGVVAMSLYPAALFAFSGVPVKTCLRKLRFVLPLVMAVGLANPFLDRSAALAIGGVTVTGGVLSMLTLTLKGVFCLAASFLLMATTSIDALCAALRSLHVPGTLVTLLLLTYRYVGVMTEELANMTAAYHLRAPGHKGVAVKAWGSFLGQLLLRSADRAEELYASMRLRGFSGRFYYARAGKCGPWDAAHLLATTALCAACRFGNLAGLLGGLIAG